MLDRLPRLLAVLGSLAGVVLPTAEAFACPDCETSRVVRASVLDESFWPHLVAISLPLLVLGVITALLYRMGR